MLQPESRGVDQAPTRHQDLKNQKHPFAEQVPSSKAKPAEKEGNTDHAHNDHTQRRSEKPIYRIGANDEESE